MGHSTSATHDRILGKLGAGPAFLSDPNFTVEGFDQTIFAGGPNDISPQFGNSSSEGYSNVTMELLNLGDIQVSSDNPSSIGSVGAANAGFGNFTVTAANGAFFTQTVTVRLVGERGGDLYEAVDTFVVTVESVFLNGQG